MCDRRKQYYDRLKKNCAIKEKRARRAVMIAIFIGMAASAFFVTNLLWQHENKMLQQQLEELKEKEYQKLKEQYLELTFAKYQIIKKSCNKYAPMIIKKSNGRIKPTPRLICAIIKEESDFSSTAISSSGAVGDMQLMAGTARDLHVTDRTDPEQNIDGGIRHLFFTCGPKADYNIHKMIALYNCGQNRKVIPESSKRYASRCIRNMNQSNMLVARL